jgi:large subunit ribosomal protein L33
MAKKKGVIENVQLQCESCKQRNYSIRKNRKKNPDRLEVSKYCPFERVHKKHKEIKK